MGVNVSSNSGSAVFPVFTAEGRQSGRVHTNTVTQSTGSFHLWWSMIVLKSSFMTLQNKRNQVVVQKQNILNKEEMEIKLINNEIVLLIVKYF